MSTNDHSWLDQKFLTTALRHGLADPNLEVQKCDVYPGTDVGDNYGSIVYRATVEAEVVNRKKVYKLVIKCVPRNEVRKRIIDTMCYFTKEINMYEVIFPEFQILQREHGGRAMLCSVPRCYYTLMDQQRDCLVLEDLGPLGYKMADRLKGLDYQHCRLVFAELGKFHAFSYAMKVQEPEKFKEKLSWCKETLYCEQSKEMYEPFFQHQIYSSMSLVKQFPCCKNVVEKFESLKGKVFDRLVELFVPEEPLSVILHGDFWLNNLLFSYETKAGTDVPKDVKLLDFQIVRYASPALDLVNFIYSSTTKEVRSEHLQELLELYYSNFARTVEALGAQVGEFTFEALQREIKRKTLFAFTTACVVLPVMMTKKEDTPDMDSITEADVKNPNKERLGRMFRNNELTFRLRDVFSELDENYIM